MVVILMVASRIVAKLIVALPMLSTKGSHTNSSHTQCRSKTMLAHGLQPMKALGYWYCQASSNTTLDTSGFKNVS